MNFNIQSFLESAKKEQDANQKAQDNRSYPYKVVFVRPDNTSVLQVRILPNVASNTIAYKYWQHDIDGQRYMCEYDYEGHDSCPICSAINEIKNSTGVDAKGRSTTRSVMLAQYIQSSGYNFDERHPEPKMGEIIIVMGPQSLYDNVNQAILSQGPEGLTKILTEVNGAVININRDKNGRAVVVTPTFQTFASAQSQELFDQMCEALPDIRYIAHDKELSQVDYGKLVEVSNNLRKTYGVIKSQEAIGNPQPVNPAELVQSQPLVQPQIYQAPSSSGIQSVDLTQNQNMTHIVNQPTVTQPNQSQLYNSQQMQQPVQNMIPNTGVVPPIQPTATAQQPQVQPVVSQQPVAPISEDNLQYSQPDPQPVNNEQIPAYNTDGIPGNCPKKFNVLGNECIMCLKSVSCPFK